MTNNAVRPDGGFGIYVHWPFCKAKCPYCDFNSHVRHREVDQKAFARALVRELAHQHQYSSSYSVDSIFFGGGTPSLMRGETVSYIIENIKNLWSVSDDVEINLEANPTSVEAQNFKEYADAGVNRVSLGIQSLRDDDLKFLGRQHSASEALEALGVAREHFARVSADMIYTRPSQSAEAWRSELEELLEYDLDHLSLYQLTIEPQTPFEALYQLGKINLPEEGDARALFEINNEICKIAGLNRYEVSNHAKPGAECRHNLIYWNYGFYAGVGPGAHARLMDDMKRVSLVSEKNPEDWLEKVLRDGHGAVIREDLSLQQIADEFLLMGLRLDNGIDLLRYKKISGRGSDSATLKMLHDQGFVYYDAPKNRLRVTDKGLPVLNRIIEEISFH